MNAYLKSFLHRGLIFGGFGPIIIGIVYVILDYTLPDLSLNGTEVFLAVLSTYFLAFIQAGASVFNQIESWPIAKTLFFHFGSLYLAYLLCYIINTWIPFEPLAVAIFTGIFVVGYFSIWLTVCFITKSVEKRLNSKI